MKIQLRNMIGLWKYNAIMSISYIMLHYSMSKTNRLKVIEKQ